MHALPQLLLKDLQEQGLGSEWHSALDLIKVWYLPAATVDNLCSCTADH